MCVCVCVCVFVCVRVCARICFRHAALLDLCLYYVPLRTDKTVVEFSSF